MEYHSLNVRRSTNSGVAKMFKPMLCFFFFFFFPLNGLDTCQCSSLVLNYHAESIVKFTDPTVTTLPFLRAHLFHIIEIFGILKLLFLKVVKIDQAKVDIQI